MRRYLLLYIAAMFAASLLPALAAAPTAGACVITVNAEAKTSDVGSAKVSVFRLLNHSGTIHLILNNELPKPQTVTVRFNEMTRPGYDVYMDGGRFGTLTSAQLAEGLKVNLPPVVLPADRPVMQRILADSGTFINGMKGSVPADVYLISAIMSNVRNWSRTADARLRNSGATFVLLSPSDQAVEPITWVPVPTKKATGDTGKYWQAIAFERSTLYTRVKEVELRNRAISAITPLDVTAQFHSGNAPYVSVTLTNQTETTIGGKLTLQGLKGPKAPSSVSFKSLGRGKTCQARFNLAGSSVPDPNQLKVQAGIAIGQATFVTSFAVKQ